MDFETSLKIVKYNISSFVLIYFNMQFQYLIIPLNDWCLRICVWSICVISISL